MTTFETIRDQMNRTNQMNDILRGKVLALRAQLDKVVSGYDEIKDMVIVCLLADGHVLLEAVAGVLLGEAPHHRVAGHLGHDRGGGDGERGRVAFDDRLLEDHALLAGLGAFLGRGVLRFLAIRDHGFILLHLPPWRRAIVAHTMSCNWW